MNDRVLYKTWSRRALKLVLGVPLVAKLIGANVIIVAAAVVAHAPGAGGSPFRELTTVLMALGVASLVNFYLVRVALRPVRVLETLAARVSAGDFDARSTESPFADAELRRLSNTINGLLDSLAAERSRIRELGAEVVYAQEAERALVSRELHDSIAQTLAAVRFQLAAASADAESDLRNRLVAATGLIESAIEEVKNVSYSLHPRVAEDLGIEAALTTLARQVESRCGIRIDVETDIVGPMIPRNVSAMMFRVAQEALRNIEVHSHAESATVDIVAREGSIRVQVTDDGRGFDPLSIPTTAKRSALSAVKARVTLAGGQLNVDSAPDGGTRVTAELSTMKAAS